MEMASTIWIGLVVGIDIEVCRSRELELSDPAADDATQKATQSCVYI